MVEWQFKAVSVPRDDWNRIVRRMMRPSTNEQRIIESAIRHQFASNFASESADGQAWAPLAPLTVAQRLAEGFPGSHPILQRTGSFMRSYTSNVSSEKYYEFRHTGGGWEMHVGSDDERAEELEHGTERIPSRRISLLDGSQEHAVLNAIDQVFAAIVKQETSG